MHSRLIRTQLKGLCQARFVLLCLVGLLFLFATSHVYGPVPDHRFVKAPDLVLISNLVYFTDSEVVARLGCPSTIGDEQGETNCTCFYQFSASGQILDASSTSQRLNPKADCWQIYRPLPPDWGRSWCIRAGRKPSWLEQVAPKAKWNSVSGVTLITGRLQGPNPTHQLNLQWYHTFRWTRKMQIPMGSLSIVLDAPIAEEDTILGTYGCGLQAAFGPNLGLLDSLPDVTMFEKVKFSIGGGFQFDTNWFQSDSPVLCDVLQMSAAIKSHYKLDPSQEANPTRALVLMRKEDDSRRLVNAPELVHALITTGWNASLVTMGNLSFEEQLHLTADAKVMIGVHGSDMVSFMFMPFRTVVIEIMPQLLGKPVQNPELANQCRNQGKVHFFYFCSQDATLVLDPATNKPIDARPVLQANLVTVNVPDVVALVRGAVEQSSIYMFYGLSISYSGQNLSCQYDRPVPSGMLYGCSGQDC